MTMHCHFNKALDIASGVYSNNAAVLADVFTAHLNTPLSAEEVLERGRNGRAFFEECCVKFVFEEKPHDAIRDFGLELVEGGLFQLPFPVCYFEWPDGTSIRGVFAWMVDGRVSIWKFHLSPDGAHYPFSISVEELSSYLSEGRMLRDENGFYDDDAAAIESMAACVGLLAAKGVGREQIMPRPSVNAKRKAAGKREFPAYTIIRTHIVGRPSHGGTHASPRPHLRRGHVRRLDDERKTVVRPHFVMADPGTLPTYRIAKQ